MSRKTYRICLVMLIVAGMVGGFLMYRFNEQKEPVLQKGVFVKQIEKMPSAGEMLGEVSHYEG